MGYFPEPTIFLITAYIILCSTSTTRALQVEENTEMNSQNTCSIDDLNHSGLVEFSDETVPYYFKWPVSNEEVIHMYSTRAGDRFILDSARNLNLVETENERMLNINTTLNLRYRSGKKVVKGFGTILDGKKLIESIRNGSYKRDVHPILTDLIQINFSLFQITVNKKNLVNHDIDLVVQELDALGIEEDKTLKIFLIFEEIDGSPETLSAIESFSTSLKVAQALKCYSFSVNPDVYDQFKELKKLCGSRDLIRTSIGDIPTLLYGVNSTNTENKVLLLRSNSSFPYSSVQSATYNWKDGDVFAISREKPRIRKYGNWQNAQNFAVEALNHLRFDVNGFLENFSIVNVLKELHPRDCSIYNLRPNLDRHYRSPIFYALAHFSLYLPDGSKLLNEDIFTQPNMFAAHYIGFETPQNHTIAIVLNDNEHQLPFRLSVEGKIVAAKFLKPKSFNTFIIKN